MNRTGGVSDRVEDYHGKKRAYQSFLTERCRREQTVKGIKDWFQRFTRVIQNARQLAY